MYVEVIFLMIVTFVTTSLVKMTGSLLPYLLFLAAFLLVLPGIAANLWAPFVPSFKKRTKIMLQLADLKPGMTAYDLGAGDGRLVADAARMGAKSYGYELSFPLVLYFWLKNKFKKDKGVVYWGSFWNKDYKNADVLFCYLYPRTMQKFKEKIYPRLNKGTRIISNTFAIHGLKPKKEIEQVFLYIKE